MKGVGGMQEGKKGGRGPRFGNLENMEHLIEPGNPGWGAGRMLLWGPSGEGGRLEGPPGDAQG